MEPDATVTRLAERQHGLISRSQLMSMGIGNQWLRPMVRRGSLQPVTTTVFRVAGSPRTTRQDVMGAVIDSPPGAAASHQTAAALWGIPGFVMGVPHHVVVPEQGTTRRTRLSVIHFHKDMPLSEIHVLDSIPVTSPALTLFHLAAVLHPSRTERAVDNALARRLLTPARYQSLVDRIAKKGRNGSRVSRALAAARSEAYRAPESGLEQRVQWCADQAGVAVERQIELGDHEYVGRVDFRLRGLLGVIEAQSALHHSTPLDRQGDRSRSEELLSMGFSVLFVWDHQAFGKPDLVISEIQRFRRDVANGAPPFIRTCE